MDGVVAGAFGKGLIEGATATSNLIDAAQTRKLRAEQAQQNAELMRVQIEDAKRASEQFQTKSDLQSELLTKAKDIQARQDKIMAKQITSDLADYSTSSDPVAALSSIKARWAADPDIQKVFGVQNINTMRPVSDYDKPDVYRYLQQHGATPNDTVVNDMIKSGLLVSVDGNLVDVHSLNVATGAYTQMTPEQKKIYDTKVDAIFNPTGAQPKDQQSTAEPVTKDISKVENIATDLINSANDHTVAPTPQELAWSTDVQNSIAGISTPTYTAVTKILEKIPDSEKKTALMKDADYIAQLYGEDVAKNYIMEKSGVSSLSDKITLEGVKHNYRMDEINQRTSNKTGALLPPPELGFTGKHPITYEGAVQTGTDLIKTYDPKKGGYQVSPDLATYDKATIGTKGMSSSINAMIKDLNKQSLSAQGLRDNFNKMKEFTTKYPWDSVVKAKALIVNKVPDFLRNTAQDITGLSDEQVGQMMGIKGDQASVVGALAKALNGGGNLSNADKAAAARVVEAGNFFTNSKSALNSSFQMYSSALQDLKNTSDYAIKAGMPYAGAMAFNSALGRGSAKLTHHTPAQPTTRPVIPTGVKSTAAQNPGKPVNYNGNLVVYDPVSKRTYIKYQDGTKAELQ